MGRQKAFTNTKCPLETSLLNSERRALVVEKPVAFKVGCVDIDLIAVTEIQIDPFFFEESISPTVKRHRSCLGLGTDGARYWQSD